MRHTLGKSDLLRGRMRFKEILESGRKLSGNILRCAARASREAESGGSPVIGVGFTVSSRRVKAVDRNRMRRLMREAYRLNKEMLRTSGTDESTKLEILFIYSPPRRSQLQLPSYQEVEEDMKHLLNSLSRLRF